MALYLVEGLDTIEHGPLFSGRVGYN